MRSTIVGMVFGALIAVATVTLNTGKQNAFAQPGHLPELTDSNLTAFSSPTGQQLLVLDKRQRVLGVYHVDPKNGQITLRSVRNIRWDLELDDFNSSEPDPAKVRSLVSSKR